MKNASCTYFFPIIFSHLSEDKHYWGLMNFIEDTYLFYGTEDIFVIKLSKNNTYTNEPIDQDLIDKLYNIEILAAKEETENEIILYLNVPEEALKSREILLSGKFSELSDGDKMKILQFVFTFDNDDFNVYTKVSGILNKDKYLRESLIKDWGLKDSDVPKDMELRSKINITKETYTK